MTNQNYITKDGLDNVIDDTFGHTLEEYAKAFYIYSKFDFDSDTRAALEPLIAQAYENKIPTMDLINIVKQGQTH